MMTPREVLTHITAEPFKSFRIHTASGRDFEIRHPEMAQVGHSTITIYGPPEENPQGAELWQKISLLLIESIEPVEVAAKPNTN